MGIHFRHAEREDLPRCVELVARWGRGMYEPDVLGALPDFWRRLMHGPSGIVHLMIDDSLPAAERVQGIFSGAFVRADFAQALRQRPQPFLAQRVALLSAGQDSPLLTVHEVAEAQAHAELHGVGLDGTLVDARWLHPSTLRWLPVLAQAMQDWLGGYRLQSLHREVFGRDARVVSRAAGAPLVTDYRRAGFAALAALPADRRPYLMGLTREQSRHRIGSPAWMVFQFEPPQFHLTPAEQDLLLLALRDVPDEAAASRLHVSIHTIKARWQAIFEHVVDRRPDLFSPHEPGTARGPERRRHLLAYLRRHMEELRPITIGRG